MNTNGADEDPAQHKVDVASQENSDDDEPGPAPPRDLSRPYGNTRSGPAIPSIQDLELRRGKCSRKTVWYFSFAYAVLELSDEDHKADRDDLRYQRKLDRMQHKERLDELVPRAEGGTRERQLEKKREKADSNRAFAAMKTEGEGVADVPESDLFGNEGTIDEFRKRKAESDKKKNEREIRKEEILRARALEREERIRAYRDKEAETMSGLIAMAKAKFG